MKKFSKILMLLVLFVLLPKNVSALACENDDMVKWQTIAKNVSVSYDAVEKNGKVDFTVTFSNMQKGLVILDAHNNKKYNYKKNEFSISGLKSKKNYRYEIYTTEDACDNELLYTLYVMIPVYNSYYRDSLCDGIETYKLCHKWIDVEYSYDEWKKNVIDYKNSLIQEELQDEQKEKEKTLMEKVIEVYGEIYYIILPIVIIGGALIIYVYNKKRELF